MTQCLGVHTAIAEDLSLIPRTHSRLHVTPAPDDSTPSSGLHTCYTPMTQIYTIKFLILKN